MKIKLSRQQWEKIGKTAGWMKKAQILPFESEEILNQLGNLMDEEEKIRNHSGDVSAMEEATPEDLDAGFGRGMSNSEFRSSLQEPTIYIRGDGKDGQVDLMFSGNSSPSSVNAGRPRRVFLGRMTGVEAYGMIDLAMQRYQNKGLTKCV